MYKCILLWFLGGFEGQHGWALEVDLVQSSQAHGNEMIDHIINIIEVSRAFKSIRMDRVYLKLGVGKAQFTSNAITYDHK